VFPQLAGLGRSSTAIYYGLVGPDEAASYLRDPVLGGRLVTAAEAVRTHLSGARPVRLEALMGSRIDALKLISSLTLFGHVATSLHAADPSPQFAAMEEHAEIILAAAARQGFARCDFTEKALGIRG
jgi:uncharacterized protein (DUF1810 family)